MFRDELLVGVGRLPPGVPAVLNDRKDMTKPSTGPALTKVTVKRPEHLRYDPHGEQDAFGIQTLSRDDALASA